MTPLPYAVPPEEDLGAVVQVMAQKRFGCALICEDDRPIGIFTETDAVRVLADVLPAAD